MKPSPKHPIAASSAGRSSHRNGAIAAFGAEGYTDEVGVEARPNRQSEAAAQAEPEEPSAPDAGAPEQDSDPPVAADGEAPATPEAEATPEPEEEAVVPATEAPEAPADEADPGADDS